MATSTPETLPPIPAKRYFTIGEVSELCLVKPHVLRYWEQEFSSLKPVKRSGNRRYYQHHEVLLIRRIRELLYDQGFTIHGARNRLESAGARRKSTTATADPPDTEGALPPAAAAPEGQAPASAWAMSPTDLRSRLLEIRADLQAALACRLRQRPDAEAAPGGE